MQTPNDDQNKPTYTGKDIDLTGSEKDADDAVHNLRDKKPKNDHEEDADDLSHRIPAKKQENINEEVDPDDLVHGK